MKDRKIIAPIKSNGATGTAINFDIRCKLYSPQPFSQKVSISNTNIYDMCDTGLKTEIAQWVECLTKKPDAIQM